MHRIRFFCIFTVAALLALPNRVALADWTHLGGDAARSGLAVNAPPKINRVVWHATPLPGVEEYVGQSSPVVFDGRVYVNARYFEDSIHFSNRIIAYAQSDGTRLWHADIEPDSFDSWATPAVDSRLSSLIIVTGRIVTAIDAQTGATIWTRQLGRDSVNVSVAISQDLTSSGQPTNRAFVTDYNPSGNATLYAINLDAFHASANPFQPGQIAWTATFLKSSGNSPAYRDGRVIIASASGRIISYNARTGGAPQWSTSVPTATFFGGVAVTATNVYAASYAFDDQLLNSRLAKLDIATGAIRWTTACERTDSIPVVAGNRIFVSGGIDGYAGTATRVQAFVDNGTNASMLWDTHVATGGQLCVGGWTAQPAYSLGRLYVGQPASGVDFGFYQRLYVLDTTLPPTDANFVSSTHVGSGGSVAIEGRVVYSIGADGLFALTDRQLEGKSDTLPGQTVIRYDEE
ncbi:MAG: PQQ-binding-like beta-propeller repeat protein [Phycisphaerae bacterium]